MKAIVNLENMSVGYEGHSILRDVDILLRPGSFHFLTGPSGSGKSTLLRLLTLDLQATRGKVELFGEEINKSAFNHASRFRRRIGVVLQDNPMLNHLSVWDNVAVPLLVLGKRRADYEGDVTDLLQWVGLGELMHKNPKTLSGGERQRVGIARAVIGKPVLLLADEPTSSVEPEMARRLLRLFIELNRLGTTVIIATHDHQLMRQFKAPRLEIHDGHVKVVDGKERGDDTN